MPTDSDRIPNEDPRIGALMGALVADAAALGLHWIYDPDRIAAIISTHGSAAFVPIDPAHHADVPAYFAHGARRDGMQSQYGECLALAMRVINEGDGTLDTAAHKDAFLAHFDMGGTYVGYIDRPTRAAVANMRDEVLPSGSDDDQLPALTRLPALIAANSDNAAVMDAVEAVVSITNVNDEAIAFGRLFAELLQRVIDGENVPSAMKASIALAPAERQASLIAALETSETDSVAYGAVTERACHLYQGMPLAFHILAHASDYADAIERNIAAGGDSCGRSIVVGAVMGAASGGEAIPSEWLDNLLDVEVLLEASYKLVANGTPA